MFSLWIKIICLAPLADISACFKQKLTFCSRKRDLKSFYMSSKCILIQECLENKSKTVSYKLLCCRVREPSCVACLFISVWEAGHTDTGRVLRKLLLEVISCRACVWRSWCDWFDLFWKNKHSAPADRDVFNVLPNWSKQPLKTSWLIKSL